MTNPRLVDLVFSIHLHLLVSIDTATTMSAPNVNPTPRPSRPPRRGPSPLLFLGVILASTGSFYYLLNRKQADIRSGKAKVRRQMENPLVPVVRREGEVRELERVVNRTGREGGSSMQV